MKYEIKPLEKSKVQITFELSDEDIASFRKDTLSELSKKVEVKGFRKGHIPEEILIQKLGDTYITEESKEKAIQKYYIDAILKENLSVISRPSMQVDSQTPFKYTLTVAVFPEGTLKDHKSIKVEIKKPEVNEKEVEEIIENFKKRHISWKETEEAAKKGDKMELDFEGFDDEGKAVENTASKNHPIILGEGMIVKSFEDQLEGLKKGEKKDLKVKFPENYHKKDFQNKSFTFKTEIKAVFNPVLPELNEELVEKISSKKQSVEEFKKELKEALLEQKKMENRQKAEDEYISKLIEAFSVDLPDEMIDEEIDYIISDFEHRLSHSKMTINDFLKQNNMDMTALREKNKKEAEKRLSARLAIRKAMELDDITVSEDEINAELSEIKNYYPQKDHDKIMEDFEKGSLKSTISNRLAIKKFFDKVFDEKKS